MIFNPVRLVIARKRRKLNQKRLADLIGVTSITICRWEKGEVLPTDENLSNCADALKFPVDFFYADDIDQPLVETTSFRSQTSMSAAIRDASLAAGAIGFQIIDWVETKFVLPQPMIPDLSSFEPEAAAAALRSEWGLGEKPVPNMIKLLENKGIKVFSLAENTKEVNAYSLWRNKSPYIFLNNFKSAECSRFDAAHELGHLVLHQDCKVAGRIAEDQANLFASCFLMPKADILACLPSVIYLGQLIDAKRRWKVSLSALAYRLHKVGIISDWKYRDYCIEIGRRGYRVNEPNGIPRESSELWDKVLKALWNEGVTLRNMSNLMKLPQDDIADLVFGLLQVEPVESAINDLKLV